LNVFEIAVVVIVLLIYWL